MKIILKSPFGNLDCNIATPYSATVSLPLMEPCTMGKHTFSFILRLSKHFAEMLGQGKLPMFDWAVDSRQYLSDKPMQTIPPTFRKQVENKVIELLEEKVDSNPILQCDVACENIKMKISDSESAIVRLAKEAKEAEFAIATHKENLVKYDLELKATRKKYLTKTA